MEPGDRHPAPGVLRLVQRFVNSVDLEDRQDQIGTPERLRAWLAEHQLPGSDAPIGEPDLRRVLEFREALRALLFANNEGSIDAEAIATLNRAAENAGVLVQFQSDGTARLVPGAPGIDGALGQILAHVFTAMAEGNWGRFKACRKDTCRWAFYDSSKNQSGTWCSMAICGSRIKARTYRQRRAGKPPATG